MFKMAVTKHIYVIAQQHVFFSENYGDHHEMHGLQQYGMDQLHLKHIKI